MVYALWSWPYFVVKIISLASKNLTILEIDYMRKNNNLRNNYARSISFEIQVSVTEKIRENTLFGILDNSSVKMYLMGS